MHRSFPQSKTNPIIKTEKTETFFKSVDNMVDGTEEKIIKNQSYVRVRLMLRLLLEDIREVIILRHYPSRIIYY